MNWLKSILPWPGILLHVQRPVKATYKNWRMGRSFWHKKWKQLILLKSMVNMKGTICVQDYLLCKYSHWLCCFQLCTERSHNASASRFLKWKNWPSAWPHPDWSIWFSSTTSHCHLSLYCLLQLLFWKLFLLTKQNLLTRPKGQEGAAMCDFQSMIAEL